MLYQGKLIVKNDEGVRERHDWGELNKLLCKETTADDEFTFGDMTYRPGGVRGPDTGDEAFHTLRGEGIVRVWPDGVAEDEPITLRLRPGVEYYARYDVRRTVECTSSEPLFGVFFFCHVERPCHAHRFSHPAGVGNTIHRHGPDVMGEFLRQDFVEAMYLVRGPGSVSLANPTNMVVTDHAIDEGTAVFHPLNSLHRQFNPAETGGRNFWIHAGYFHGRGNVLAGTFEMPEFTFWHREP